MFRPSHHPVQPQPSGPDARPLNWDKNVEPLRSRLVQGGGKAPAPLDKRRVEAWSPRQVSDFVTSILGNYTAGKKPQFSWYIRSL